MLVVDYRSYTRTCSSSSRPQWCRRGGTYCRTRSSSAPPLRHETVEFGTHLIVGTSSTCRGPTLPRRLQDLGTSTSPAAGGAVTSNTSNDDQDNHHDSTQKNPRCVAGGGEAMASAPHTSAAMPPATTAGPATRLPISNAWSLHKVADVRTPDHRLRPSVSQQPQKTRHADQHASRNACADAIPPRRAVLAAHPRRTHAHAGATSRGGF